MKSRPDIQLKQPSRAAMVGAPERFLSLPQVMSLAGVSRTTIYDWAASGYFPQQRKLGPRKVGWLQSEIDEWVRSRKAV